MTIKRVFMTMLWYVVYRDCFVRGTLHAAVNPIGARLTLENEMDHLDQVFRGCDVEHVLLLTSSEETFWPVHWVMSHPFLHGFRMIHIDMDYTLMINTSVLTDLLWDCYFSKQVRHIVIVTQRYQVVMDSAHQLYYDRQRGGAAVFPHKTTFTIVVPTPGSGEDFPNMANVVMDNVALVTIDATSKKVTHIFTLMYREERRRQWEAVDFSGTFSNKTSFPCQMFPNLMFGLNGRNLTILAKEWLSHLYIKFNVNTGQNEYAGFYVDIIKALSSSVNFTYIFTPGPNEENGMNWNEFSNRVVLGEVDFGATTYIVNSALYLNHSVSFPIIWSNISGVYVNNERNPVISPLKLFRLEVYLCLLSSILYTMSLYFIITNFSKEILKESLKRRQKLLVTTATSQDLKAFANGAPRNSYEEMNSKHQYLDSESSLKNLNSDVDKENGQSKQCNDNKNDSWTKNDDHDYKPSELNVDNVPVEHLDVSADDPDQLQSTCTNQTSQQCEECRWTDVESNNQNSTSYRSIGTQTTDDDTNLNPISPFVIPQFKYWVSPSYCKICNKKEIEVLKTKEKITDVKLNDFTTKSSLPEMTTKVDCFHGVSKFNKPPLEDTIGLFFKFVGSIFSQDSLPEPRNCSARLLLWSWCLMLLVLTAVFTGNITANLVDQDESIPFSTFEQLLQRSDYRWGLFKESSFFNVMKNSRQGTTLRRLYDKMETFAQTDPSVIGSFEDQMMKVTTEKYVTFFFSGDLEYLRVKHNVSNLVIMKDNFMSTNMGFIFPQNSTLNDLISERLLLMSDVGLLEHLLQANDNVSTSSKVLQGKNSSNMALDLYYMEGLFYCCGYGLTMASAVLLLEYLYHKMCN